MSKKDRSNEIMFMVWDSDVSRRVLAFGNGREEAKRKAHQILKGDKDAYTVEPLTAPGVGVYLAGALSELHS